MCIMVDSSAARGVGAIVLICAIGGIFWAFRSAIRKGDNKTAKSLLRVSDTIVTFKFFKALFFFAIFLVILVVAGGAGRDGFIGHHPQVE